MEPATIFDPTLCAECGTALLGDYCHACGQRRLSDDDRRLKHLVGEALASFTSLEGRWARSLGLLVTDTGALSRAWLAGQRQRYLRPFSLFLMVNLLFFVAPPMTDFDLHLSDHFGQPFYGGWAQSQVGERLAAEGISFEDYSARFGRESSTVSKTLIIVHVPVLALFLMLGVLGRRWTYAEHVVVALHLFAFALLAAQLLTWVLLPALGAAARVLPLLSAVQPRIGFVALALIVVAWWRALRRAYGQGAMRAAATMAVAVVGLGVAHLLYRAVQFALVFALA